MTPTDIRNLLKDNPLIANFTDSQLMEIWHKLIKTEIQYEVTIDKHPIIKIAPLLKSIIPVIFYLLPKYFCSPFLIPLRI